VDPPWRLTHPRRDPPRVRVSQCHSYRSCLEVAAEAGLRSVALGSIHLASKGYPRVDAAHVSLRTIRRFLERYADTFECVVIAGELPGLTLRASLGDAESSLGDAESSLGDAESLAG
jgi:O-acetyl-ADP-ribose deacetylase (regulator of RNase III)